MVWIRRLLGAAGALATALGLGLLFVSDLFTVGPVETAIAAVDAAGAQRAFLFVGAGVIAYLAVALRTPRDRTAVGSVADDRFERVVENPPETVDTSDRRLTAADIDDGIESAIEDGGERVVALRQRLRTTAASVYGDVTGTPEGTARAAIDRGQWCHDPVAAAFLAGPEGPSYPLGAKIRLLLIPGNERRRRIERTITAIEQLEYT